MRDIVVDLGDDLANQRPDLPGANSPFAILTHCLGVTARWASTVNLGEVVPRDRDAEFTATGAVADLAADTDRMRESLREWVARTDPAAPPANPTSPARTGMPRPGWRAAARLRGAGPAPRPAGDHPRRCDVADRSVPSD